MFVLSKYVAMESHLCPIPLLVNYLKWLLSFRYSTLPSLTYDIFSKSSLRRWCLVSITYSLLFKNYFIYLLYVCFCLCVPWHASLHSEDNLWKLGFSLSAIGTRNQTQAIRLGGSSCWPLHFIYLFGLKWRFSFHLSFLFSCIKIRISPLMGLAWFWSWPLHFALYLWNLGWKYLLSNMAVGRKFSCTTWSLWGGQCYCT